MNKKLQFSNEQILAQVAFMAALKSTKTIDAFACWLLAGFGIALSFIIANCASINVSTIKIPLIFFFIATSACVIQKYLAVIITCGFETSDEVEKKIRILLNKNGNMFDDLDFEKYFKEAKKPYWMPLKFILHISFEKLKKGDLTANARFLIHCFQAQGVLVFIQAVFLIVCAWKLLLK